ncbi:MAG: iron-containing alcohol dehydrogenase [Desulfobacterales bacterium]
MHFEFGTANRIIFGAGATERVGRLAADLGRRALVVCGRSPERAEVLEQKLKIHDLTVRRFSVGGEPDLERLAEGLSRARGNGTEVVIGFGGGSVIDTAKALAAMINNPGDVMDYLEVIGRGRPLANAPAPCIAVPTTAGTGAEVTCNAVLKSAEHGVKVSLRSPLMFPRFAVVDPELTLSLPPPVTAATGMDALTQLIEAYVSKKSNPLTDSLCRDGIKRIARSLRTVFSRPDDISARSDMSLGSLFSGLALANAGLGAVHGMAGPLGGLCDAPHGVICANLLPGVVKANVQALRDREPASAALGRYQKVSRWLTGSRSATVTGGIDWLYRLVGELHIPRLSDYGLQPSDTTRLAAQSLKASSMRTNPVALTIAELEELLFDIFALKT